MPHDPTPLQVRPDDLMTQAGGRRRPRRRRGRRRRPGRARHPHDDHRPWWRRALATGLPPLVALLLFLLVWQLVWASAITDEFKVPAPVDVWQPFAKIVDDGQRLVDPLDLGQPRVPRVRRRAGHRDAAGPAGREGAGSCGPRSGRCCRAAEPAVGGLGAGGGALVRADRRHDLLRRARRLGPVDRQRAGRRHRPGPADPAAGRPGARRARARQCPAHPAAGRAARVPRRAASRAGRSPGAR